MNSKDYPNTNMNGLLPKLLMQMVTPLVATSLKVNKLRGAHQPQDKIYLKAALMCNQRNFQPWVLFIITPYIHAEREKMILSFL